MLERVFMKVDMIFVGAKSGIEACVSVFMNGMYRFNGNLIGEKSVQAVEEKRVACKFFRSAFPGFHIEMGEELPGVYTCVCPSAAYSFYILPENSREGLVKKFLHGNRIRLNLPAVKPGSIIR